jgi:MFS family permease
MTTAGRRMSVLIIVEIVVLWIAGIAAFATLPDRVVTHFNAAGAPDAHGSKSMFLFLPLAFSIAPVIVLAASAARFRLINDYPYLINLPAFFSEVWARPMGERGRWVNLYFERVLALGAALTGYMLALMLVIYRGTLDERLSAWFLPFVLALPIVLAVLFMYSLQRLSRRLKEAPISPPPTAGT